MKKPDELQSQSEALTHQLSTPTDSKSRTSEHVIDLPVLTGSRYRLIQMIDRGGMGIIFQAHDTQLGRDVAIKILRIDRATNVAAKHGFLNEARIMSFLSHPGVTPIYECGSCVDGRPFYVMKLICGTTLADLLKSRTSSTSHLLYIFADICQTVAFAHSCGVIHLDLKPGNVMVGEFGEVYLMDWGLARFEGQPPEGFERSCSDDSDSSRKTTVNGTPEYMSPEQARGRTLDAHADVFSLGAILCEILVGHAPYEGDSVHEIYVHAVNASMKRALEDLDACEADQALVRLAKQCLSRRRSHRPATAIEVAKIMAAYQESALQRMESDMNRFFELSLDMFCIADRKGYFRRINANFSKVLGHSDADLLTKPFLDFVHPDDVAETISVMKVLDDGQDVVRFRNRYRTVDGNYKVLEWMAKTVDDEGIIFAVARDVT